jgi:hypothetical protein
MNVKMNLIFILIFSVTANAYEARSFRFDQQSKDIIDIEDRRLTISKSCLQKNEKFACAAYTAFQKAAKLRSSQTLPPEIGEDLCLQSGGKIAIGISAKLDQATFCVFSKDGSVIDLGSLYASYKKLGQ